MAGQQQGDQPGSVSGQPAGLYDQILADLQGLSANDLAVISQNVFKATKGMVWIPNPGPQTGAYNCLADVMLYGGEGGGGKTGLIAGLALTAHKRSLVVRRHYADLSAVIEEIVEFHDKSRKGFTGSPRPKLRTKDDRLIEFGACANPGDEEHWMGQAHDLLAIDEAVQLLESQVRLLMGWVRTSDSRQRCRTVLATNPPVKAEGRWIIPMFRPWLDITHPNPAKQGELRWFVTDPDGNDMEVPDATPIELTDDRGVKRTYIPKSRTFIRARLSDNPFLANSGYQATLDGLQGVLRDAVRDGNFMVSLKDRPWQTIPTEWIRLAQERWTKAPPQGVPMCAIAADVAQGGDDNTVIAKRHDGWFAPLISVPGKLTPYGRDVAALIIKERREPAEIIIDMGGGYGGAALEHLEDNGFEVYGYKGNRAATKRTRDGRNGFLNFRSQSYWMFREALDPDQPGGSPIMLPDDPMLVADLTAPDYDSDNPHGYAVESKEDVVKKLGRSTDKGDAVVMCWARGKKAVTDGAEWGEQLNRGHFGSHQRVPSVVMGRQAARQAQQRSAGGAYGVVRSGPDGGRGWGRR